MVAVKDKTRYTPPDAAVYMTVLKSTDPHTCLGISLVGDPILLEMACRHAMMAVPLNDPPKGSFNVAKYVRERLQQALLERDRWYAAHLPAEGRA